MNAEMEVRTAGAGRRPGALRRLLYSRPARALSLLVASVLAAIGLVYPAPLAVIDHGMLMLMMWGVAAAFTHGVGYVPANRLNRLVLGPLAAWCLLGVTIVAVIVNSV